MSVVTYIGLGSNLGDSRQILTEAVQNLATLGTRSLPSAAKYRRYGA